MIRSTISSILLLSYFASAAIAQESTDTAPTQPNEPLTEGSEFLSGIIDFLIDPRVIGGLIVTIVGGIIVFSIQEYMKKKYYVPASELPGIKHSAVQEFIDKLHKPQKLDSNQIRSSTIIAGIGGAGKTRLINRLFSNERADSQKATKEFKVYQSASLISSERLEYAITFNVADYAGQDFGTLVEGFIKEQSEENTPFRHKYITSLILVVDIFWPPRNNNAPRVSGSEKNVEDDRIQANVDEWSDTALDALFAMALGNELAFICLFINKVDILENEDREGILAAYDSLLLKLQKRGRGAEVLAVIGSAERGEGLFEIKDGLHRSAVPHI